jgi:hypothetical protein
MHGRVWRSRSFTPDQLVTSRGGRHETNRRSRSGPHATGCAPHAGPALAQLIDRTQNPNTANDGIAKSLAERPSVTPLCGSTPLASVVR